tara:strand:- start:244 stop:1380 length:1137 start_codon:yes stop_codon:yes gene_type:complete
MVNAYAGEAYRLVFPILSNGYLLLNYDETVTQIEGTTATVGGTGDTAGTPTTDTITATRERQIWGHKDSFTLEAIVTPYDVNGLGNRTTGHGVLDSTKTPPYPNNSLSNRITTYESVSVLHGSNYRTQKMMLFYNTNLKFYLQNTTESSYNQPAEYKLVAEMTSGGVTKTITSDIVISATSTLHNYYDAGGYYEGNSTSFTKLSSNASSALGDAGDAHVIVQNGEADSLVAKGTKIYDENLNLIGETNSVSQDAYSNNRDAINLKADRLTAVTSTVYVPQLKEAMYLEQTYKFSLVYLKGGYLELYVNNGLVKREQISMETLQLDASDCRIGRGTTNQEQFYGELFEISMHTGKKPCATYKTLTPNYNNILFYYAFGV